MKEKFAKLFEVKSIVTIVLTFAMVALMFMPDMANKELLMLFSSTYGAVITYFFTRKKDGDGQ